ncbi:MAG: hypothetical protein ABI162_03580 [Luteolibacter sp.]
MKTSIALSVLILALGSAWGLHDRQLLAAALQTHAKLTAEAAQLGISIDSKNSANSVHLTKRSERGERENKDAEARLAAKEFVAFAKEMEAIEKKGGPPDDATQKRVMAFLDRIMSLDSSQLKILIAEVHATPDLKDKTRQGLIGFSIMMMASDHPQAALAMFTESSDLFKDNGMGKHVVSTSLAKWAKDDPMGALEWVRKNGEKFPDLVTDDAKRGLVSGAAANDPALAFKLIGELGLKDTANVIADIFRAAKTDEDRTATLAALRSHVGTMQDAKAAGKLRNSGLEQLGANLSSDNYDSAQKWLAGAKLSPEELGAFADGIQSDGGNNGQWIEWLGKSLPADQSDGKIKNIVSNWTQNDYQAAGAWLNTTPAGPAKNIAIRSYAETVSRYEPEAAVPWAVTLPPGKDRDETLRGIYVRWPKKDDASKAAAEAFKTTHGIK